MFPGLKTYFVGVVAIIGAIAAYLTGDLSIAAAAQAILTAVLGMTIRSGITTEVAKK
jgi:hypothetical protein